MENLIHSQKGLLIFTVVAVIAAWGGMIEGGYVSDDWTWLERASENTVLREGKFFRPVCWLTWVATPLHHPSVSHSLDLFVHWLCAYAVGVLIVNLGGSWLAGLGAGIIFATMPTLHEAICWSSARCGPFAMCLVLIAISLVLQGSRWVVVPIILMAFGVKETALFAMWGIPLMFMARKANRSALAWLGICTVFFILYLVIISFTGSFENLGGGYAASFRLERSLHHLGAYMGMIIGASGMAPFWSVWIFLGLATIIPFAVGSRLPSALWFWQSILFVPFIRLGGPEQLRFLYPLSIVPLIGMILVVDRISKGRSTFRIVLSILLITLAGMNIVRARRFSDDWLKASRISEVIIQKSLHRLEPEHPHVLINPPEFVGNAHVFRNGLLESLRLVSGNRLFRGVSIAQTEKVVSRGDLQEWLENRAPELVKNEKTAAWLFQDNRPLPLKGWRLPVRMDEPLEQLVIMR